MIHRLVILFIILPVAVLLIALAVSNRVPTPFTIDPFNPGNPALTMELPLFIWLFAAMVIGMLVGSLATWIRQGRYRRAARENRRRPAVTGGDREKAGTAGRGTAITARG